MKCATKMNIIRLQAVHDFMTTGYAEPKSADQITAILNMGWYTGKGSEMGVKLQKLPPATAAKRLSNYKVTVRHNSLDNSEAVIYFNNGGLSDHILLKLKKYYK